MDNKITKRRLHDFLAYEWIAIIAVIIAGIIAWNLIFTMTGVRLTVGQDFKFFYDETIESSSSNDVYELFERKDASGKTVFSYDILKFGHEALLSEYNVLRDRLTVQEGDVIITDASEPSEEGGTVRAEAIVDNYPVCDFESLKDDAEKYLAQFLKDNYLEQDGNVKVGVDVTDFSNFDASKIEAVFRQRMKKDNRYRTESQKQEGIKLEKERISDLCREVKKFRYLLEQGDEYFFKYKRYDQTVDKRYGLKVESLSGGAEKDSPSKYFKKKGATDAKDVVILVFDLIEHQPHLQFEAIAFINAIVYGCSNLYDGI